MPSNIAFSTHWNSSRNKVSSSLMGVYYLLSSPYVIYAALPSWINSCLTTHFRSVFPKLNYFLRVINSWSGCTRHVNNRFRKIYLIPWGKRDVPKAPGSSLTFAGSSFISDFHLILSFGKREAPGTKLELKKKVLRKRFRMNDKLWERANFGSSVLWELTLFLRDLGEERALGETRSWEGENGILWVRI